LKVRTPGRIWTALENQKFFACGYCFQRMALYSTRALTPSEDVKNVLLYYGCSKRCQRSGIHRTPFVDRKLFEFLYNRLREHFPEAKGSTKEMDNLTATFEKLQDMENDRQEILEMLPHAGFNRDELIEEIIQLEEEMDSVRKEISGVDTEDPSASPLLAPVFVFDNGSELMDLNLLYQRELVRALIMRIRFFNETLIVRPLPLNEEERRLEEESFGKAYNINLTLNISPISTDEIMSDDEVEEDKEEKPKEKIDIDFILNPPTETTPEIVRGEKVDLEYIMTEPGSEEEKKLRKKKKPAKKERRSRKGKDKDKDKDKK